MDDSQSSDIFSETSANIKYTSTIEIEKYEELVSKIKASAHGSVSTDISIVQDYFTVLLEDCSSCILQSLSLIISLLEDTNTEVDKLCDYIENAVCILQILSNFVKTIIESVAITCSTVKNFGTCTGNIILSVFTHCKDSECIYGDSLCTVGKQLKDLFRNCHDLQLIYLMTLEKHMVFDLNEKEDHDILLKTLDLNLKIGDVVQSLDVKTMAEQWKAYTMICEKYSNFLLDENIFNTTSRLLASTTENNIRTALEVNEEDKIVIRSLKVANFSLKILLRLCSIFKRSINSDYEDITKLLLHMSL
ncbi:jg483 [Pararge aegeria aegeria]|uniref:Jg483 protein n=1 Tax=Pararge aegeria aegeria TaxID=348720 RepID=A0A8S4SID8_9NEOP|nr:jg483 [Pararge aegeria aegeria]